MFPKSVRRDIIWLICIKVAVLVGIYYALFAPVTRPEPDAQVTTAHLLRGSGN